MHYLLHQSIDRAAERHGARTAFRFLDRTLCYAELATLSDRLARALRENGVCPGDRVGILMHKCLESPLAVYGILKAGAAYVPLDPGLPDSRLRDTITHCGIRCLVTQPQKRETVVTLLDALGSLECIVGLEEDAHHQARCLGWGAVRALTEDGAPDVRRTERDLAYIISTSGSTGRPKGIMHTHASGLAYARMAAATYDITHEDRLGNHSPLHFDMSTLEFLAGPLCGAETVIIPEPYTKLPASLSQLIQDTRLTIWYSVPHALIQMLLRGMLTERDTGNLRWVLYGGEPFPPKHLHALRRLWPHARFSNVYGPAEVNQCTCYNIPHDAPVDDSPIPIGSVCPNVETLVVDENDRPVRENESGELLVRTPTMMRGYWNQPDLNERAFFRRPVTAGVSDVFYRTGDLVERRDDGNLMFLGRKDRQVKTRGCRVEMDEVEAALTAHHRVEEAAAYLVPGGEDTQYIEAAVVLRSGEPVVGEELRAHCSRRLPWYAVPTEVLLVDDFPRTTSGKIDRRTLRGWALDREGEVVRP